MNIPLPPRLLSATPMAKSPIIGKVDETQIVSCPINSEFELCIGRKCAAFRVHETTPTHGFCALIERKGG